MEAMRRTTVDSTRPTFTADLHPTEGTRHRTSMAQGQGREAGLRPWHDPRPQTQPEVRHLGVGIRRPGGVPQEEDPVPDRTTEPPIQTH
jgi:hypothetical protein